MSGGSPSRDSLDDGPLDFDCHGYLKLSPTEEKCDEACSGILMTQNATGEGNHGFCKPSHLVQYICKYHCGQGKAVVRTPPSKPKGKKEEEVVAVLGELKNNTQNDDTTQQQQPQQNTKMLKKQRTFDDQGYTQRAACVCVKNKNETEVLLISSRKNQTNWIIPGGGIEEHDESPQEAAKREVYEEAGVRGRIDRFLGVFKDRNQLTNVYIMIVDEELDDWSEKEKRLRKWFSVVDAKTELEKYKPTQGLYLNNLLLRSA